MLSFKPLPTAFPQRSLGFHKSCLKAQFIHFEALPSSTCCPIIKLMLLVGFSYGSTPFPNIKICSGYWLLHSKPLQHLVKIAVIYCAYKSAIWGGLGKDSSFLPQVVSTGATSLGAGESILQVSPSLFIQLTWPTWISSWRMMGFQKQALQENETELYYFLWLSLRRQHHSHWSHQAACV